jgi:hypothetical protein
MAGDMITGELRGRLFDTSESVFVISVSALKKLSFKSVDAFGRLDGSRLKHFDSISSKSGLAIDDGNFGESSVFLRWKKRLIGFL